MSIIHFSNLPIYLAILTVSDTRTEQTDQGGLLVATLAEESSIHVIDKKICKDDVTEILTILMEWYTNEQIDCIITTGGTGIAKRDVTIEAILPTFTKEMPGFGELFRYLSFTEDVGTKAMLSRAAAGIFFDKAVFVLPGSVKAIKLAMTKLILPELQHILYELKK